MSTCGVNRHCVSHSSQLAVCGGDWRDYESSGGTRGTFSLAVSAVMLERAPEDLGHAQGPGLERATGAPVKAGAMEVELVARSLAKARSPLSM